MTNFFPRSIVDALVTAVAPRIPKPLAEFNEALLNTSKDDIRNAMSAALAPSGYQRTTKPTDTPRSYYRDRQVLRARLEVEEQENWRDDCQQMPELEFKAGWKVKVLPPFAGVAARKE